MGSGGRIINFADWLPASGRRRYRGFVPYYASKARGRSALTESLALELAPDVLVNAIAPGPILAPPDLTPNDSTEVMEATPLRRWGGAVEIAKAVLFLVDSDDLTSRRMLRVDGDRHPVLTASYPRKSLRQSSNRAGMSPLLASGMCVASRVTADFFDQSEASRAP